MKVKELIDILQTFEPDAVVNCQGWCYNEVEWQAASEVEQTTTGWDNNNNCPIYEVFIE